MKKYYVFLATLLFSFSLQAQIIDFPDANFKAALIEDGVDTSGDGEIEVSEAEVSTNLYLNNESITSLEGIEYFINLEQLTCRGNQITNLNLSNLTNLRSLDCSYNQLTELTLVGLTDLEHIDCSYNDLTILDANSLTSLITLACYENNLSQININSSTNLTNLNCSINLLANINITNSPNLNWFDCSYNNLNSIDISSQSSLHYFDCSNNNLTSLDLTELEFIEIFHANENQLASINLCEITNELWIYDNLLTSLDVSNSPTINNIFCHNNLLTTFDINNNLFVGDLYPNNNELTSINFGIGHFLDWSSGVSFSGNPNLSVVCTIEDNFNDVQNILNFYNYTECTISSYCSFEPYGEYYVVNGQAFYDSNNDSCDFSDSPIPNLEYIITNNSINDSFISYTNGQFNLYLDSGSHTITPNFENPEYYSTSPSSLTVNFPSDTSPYVQNFCVTANGVYNDLEVAVLPVEAARPGFNTNYKLVYKNKGTTTLSGNVGLSFQDDLMDFVSAIPTPDSQTSGSLTWNFSDLTPFEIREIAFTMGINAPTDTPPVNGDDVLVFEASVNHSETDETPDDNTAVFNQTVVNSYDPNDKTCLQGDYITPEEVGKYVDYLIRFENTGTASAVNIVVKDDIDVSKYDLSTLVPLHASHDYFARIKDQGGQHYIEFIFEDINLPFDDANNDGYVAFKIKTLETLVLGDSFDNNAEIYFDYNFPIITDEATTTVAALSVDEFGYPDNGVELYPNPTTNILNLESKQPIEHVTIFDVSGRVIQEIAVVGTKNNMTLSTENLTTGTYFLKIKTGNGETVRKVMKD